jgi:peptidoglycan/LPS O-acetylase OafA/YrhL
LRAFLTVLVVAHHAFLAYNVIVPKPAASLTAQPRWWGAFPVVDAHRSMLLSLVTGFNDVFFMSLMFLISGLFVWRSLERKGARVYLADRARRLGIPFIAAVVVLAPLAYYPAYLQTGAAGGIRGFMHQWLSLGNLPAGPAWFIWVLLAFDCVATVLFAYLPKWHTGCLGPWISARPALMWAWVASISATVYIPLALKFNPFMWASFGPFTFQTSRILHYLVYFLIGVALGAQGIDRALWNQRGKLARRWPLWLAGALMAFAVNMVIAIVASRPGRYTTFVTIISSFAFVVNCAASSFALIAIFARYAQTRLRALDSLSTNAYGIYLLHYVFVNWLQYAILPVNTPAALKGLVVLAFALVLSWASTAALRRIPVLRRTI